MANFPVSTISGEYLARVVGVEAANQRYLIDRMRRLPGLADGMTSVLKRNAYIQGRVLKPLKEVAKKADKAINIFDKLFKKVPGGGDNAAKASKMSPVLGLLLTLGVYVLATFNTKLIEQRQAEQQRINDRINQNISDVLTTVDTVNKRVKETNKTVDKLDERLTRADKEAYSAAKNATSAREKANDALYEVRKGRGILELRIDNTNNEISKAKKQANDALYETRKGKEKLQDQINKINKDLGKYLTGVKDNFQERIDTTVKNIVKSLDKNTDKVVEHNKAIIALQDKLKTVDNKAIIALQDTLKVVDKVVKDLPKAVLSIKSLEDFTIKLINGKVQPIEVDVKKAVAATTETKQNGVTKKEYDGTIASLRATYDKSFEAIGAKWNEQLRALQGKVGEVTKVVGNSDFVSSDSKITKDVATLTKTVEKNKTDLEKKAAQDKSDLEKKINDTKGTLDKKINDTRSDLEKKIGSVPTIDPAEIDKIKRDNDQNKKDVKDLIPRIKEAEDKIKEQKKVNDSAIPKLDDILKALPLIPGKAADAIKPSIPTKDDIKQATGQAICSSLNGGCSGQANADLANNINNNTNNRAGDILGAVNAAENTAQIGLLNTINSKLGDPVTGGLSGFMNRIVKNQWVDRSINLITMTAAVHNVVMLSDQVATTFFGILDNVLAIPALIVDPNAETIDTKQAFGGLVDGFFKNIFGVTQWAEIKTKWATANRIYQAAANGANEIRSIGGNIISAVEQTARLTGKGFNALQDEGLISENNWDYSPENLKLKGGLFAKLGKLSDGINIATEGLEAIESITSEIRSAVDSANEIKENAQEVDNGLKELFNQSKTKREEDIEKIEIPNFSDGDFS